MFARVEIKSVVWVEEADSRRVETGVRELFQKTFFSGVVDIVCSAPASMADLERYELECCHCRKQQGLTLLDAHDLPREDFEPVCQPCLDEDDAEFAAEEARDAD